jgi:hypothetical protein
MKAGGDTWLAVISFTTHEDVMRTLNDFERVLASGPAGTRIRPAPHRAGK